MRSVRAAASLVALTAMLVLGGCSIPSSPVTTAVVTTASSPSPSVSEAPVRAVDIAEGEQVEPVEVSVDGGAEGVAVTFREITIEPGASTGEHCHDGQLIAVVKEGTLTHYSATHPGGVAMYETGDSIIEGKGYPHEGRNEGDVDVVLWVTYVIPEGKPLAETDLRLCTG